ncbi:hypothetical protein [Litoribacter populi]|uniref:hypothetical protein n=1 Tax=Litoribacter populi TaxID=2598460 RepID=UPI001180BC2E|nr:hypothetical protein [Litoribacter populi]
MKKLIKSLPALGLALAATIAFAFNSPNGEILEQYAYDSNEDVWYNLTGQSPGPTTYLCNSGTVCTQERPHPDAPIVATGMFVKIGNFPIVPEDD